MLVEEEVDGGKNIGLSSPVAAHNAIQSLGEIAKANFVSVTAEALELDLLDAHIQTSRAPRRSGVQMRVRNVQTMAMVSEIKSRWSQQAHTASGAHAAA